MVQKKNKGGSPKKPVKERVVKTVVIAEPPQRSLAVVEKPQPPAVEQMTEARIIEAFDILGITAKLKDEKQKRLFIAVAKEWNLNPLKREIHAVAMGGGDDDEGGGGGVLVPVVGYEVYIERAEATGRLEYWNVTEEGVVDMADWKKSTYAVTVEIKRRDQPKPFTWKVRFVEAVAIKRSTQKPNAMWAKRPYFMTTKACIGQAFRLCFRLGMPYVDAEMDGQDEMPGKEEPKKIAEPQPKGGAVVQENGKLVVDPALASALEDDEKKKAEAKTTLKALQAEVQETFTEMAKVIEVRTGEKGEKIDVRLFSVEELRSARVKITENKDSVDLLRAWLIAAKVDLNNRKLDRELGPEAGRGN